MYQALLITAALAPAEQALAINNFVGLAEVTR